ncbi:hypothetical protein H6P81_008698 [Aristolochia fimbriata]|uniref:RNase III domain-containing protein n=1 Tax=Aristolochia fimbriata TaxID=158543 RepID=A0AAV7EIS1_ARIFI|nr:hypothetical protein H6P81_008698 [Aristolochia fimbriata]
MKRQLYLFVFLFTLAHGPALRVSGFNTSPFPSSLETLEKQIGYAFKSDDILRRAMTHASYSRDNNRALSLLGLDVVRASVSKHYLIQDIDMSVKNLDRRLSAITNGNACSADGYRLGLEKIIRVSAKTNSSWAPIVCGAYRAIFGAVAIDSGKIDVAGDVFWKVWRVCGIVWMYDANLRIFPAFFNFGKLVLCVFSLRETFPGFFQLRNSSRTGYNLNLQVDLGDSSLRYKSRPRLLRSLVEAIHLPSAAASQQKMKGVDFYYFLAPRGLKKNQVRVWIRSRRKKTRDLLASLEMESSGVSVEITQSLLNYSESPWASAEIGLAPPSSSSSEVEETSKNVPLDGNMLGSADCTESSSVRLSLHLSL